MTASAEPPVAEDAPGDTNTLTTFRAVGFFPADYAVVESSKVYASGAYWSTLRFPRFPATLPAISLVAAIETPFHANQADHTFEMGMVDSDSKPHGMRVQAIFRTAPNIEHKYGQAGMFAAAIPVNGLTFERPGEYSFTLSVDGRPLSRYPFSVIQLVPLPQLPELPVDE